MVRKFKGTPDLHIFQNLDNCSDFVTIYIHIEQPTIVGDCVIMCTAILKFIKRIDYFNIPFLHTSNVEIHFIKQRAKELRVNKQDEQQRMK